MGAMTERTIVQATPELLSDADERAAELIRCGFLERAEIAEALVEEFEEAGLEESAAAEMVGPLWAARLAEQADWPEVTDVDRLARAFDALERQAIVAAMDFTCCSSCGFAEIGAEADENARGFVFFHQQDTERAASGGSLMLRYGAFHAGGPAAAAAIGHEVVAALAAAGLRADWNGSPDSAIPVTPISWLNRLPAQ